MPANWRAYLVRQDSNLVVFNLKTGNENGKTILYVLNAEEKIKITAVSVTKDSLNFSMPVFESVFKSKRNADGSLEGIWIKGTGGAVGYPELTTISTEIETLLRSSVVDWDLIKNKCDKILSIAAEIESSFICL